MRKFYNLVFSKFRIGFKGLKFFFCSFWLIFFSSDPHIFADPDSDTESQNLADPTDPDPDPKHWPVPISMFAVLLQVKVKLCLNLYICQVYKTCKTCNKIILLVEINF